MQEILTASGDGVTVEFPPDEYGRRDFTQVYRLTDQRPAPSWVAQFAAEVMIDGTPTLVSFYMQPDGELTATTYLLPRPAISWVP